MYTFKSVSVLHHFTNTALTSRQQREECWRSRKRPRLRLDIKAIFQEDRGMGGRRCSYCTYTYSHTAAPSAERYVYYTPTHPLSLTPTSYKHSPTHTQKHPPTQHTQHTTHLHSTQHTYTTHNPRARRFVRATVPVRRFLIVPRVPSVGPAAGFGLPSPA